MTQVRRGLPPPGCLTRANSAEFDRLIPEDKKQSALEIFRNHFEKSAKDEVIHRQLEISVVTGKK